VLLGFALRVLHEHIAAIGVGHDAAPSSSSAGARSTETSGYHAATPDTLQRRFLNTGGIIENDRGQTTIWLARRTYSPVLRQVLQSVFHG
jgi:hypothetical protein